MVNNAWDHSEGSLIDIAVDKTAVATEMMVIDDGVGIFRKIHQAMNLLDERHALFELYKGKLTTDPKHHTGEGIFFSSRMFDTFGILSGGVYFSHKWGKDEDWLLERERSHSGTTVFMRLGNHTSRTLRQVFDKFTGTESEDYSFNKTVVPVQLAQYGNDKLISRSQAKRVLARVELFKTVVLDFTSVPTIGQAFADELACSGSFRVSIPRSCSDWHRSVQTRSVQVKRMITRARSVAAEGPGASVQAPDEEQADGRPVVVIA